MKKTYKCFKHTSAISYTLANKLDELSQEGFHTIESVTYVGDASILVITSKLEYDSNETNQLYLQYTLTNNLVEKHENILNMDDLLYGNTIEGG